MSSALSASTRALPHSILGTTVKCKGGFVDVQEINSSQ